MTAYYNEIDAYAAQWLRNLIAAGQIAPGDVDERDIRDVGAADLRGYTQCHFFAGIGGWSIALRLAGWPDDRPVWTGSCPCQPFSAAGKGAAGNDKRHLWPSWASLIRECRPRVVCGEQVEAAVGWGWLDLVFGDLEAEGYACGAAVLPACGVGAPHKRDRLWFVADAGGRERGPGRGGRDGEAGALIEVGADADRCGARRVGDADGTGSQGRCEHAGEYAGQCAPREAGAAFWSDVEWLQCTDGKARPTQPGLFPLAHGVRRRPSKLRAYGNAIVPQAGAAFVQAFLKP